MYQSSEQNEGLTRERSRTVTATDASDEVIKKETGFLEKWYTKKGGGREGGREYDSMGPRQPPRCGLSDPTRPVPFFFGSTSSRQSSVLEKSTYD